MLLDGLVIVVTGGSRGIGRAVCQGLAREGARVVVVGRDWAVCEEVVVAINAEGGPEALSVAADVSRAGDVERMVNETLGRFGQIDVLIASHGVIKPSKFLDITEEQWDETMDINLKGTFLCTKAVLPHMIERGQGKIITTTSLPGLRSTSGADYAVSKAAILQLTHSLARELKAMGTKVTINCISPVAETRMSESLAEFRGISMEEFRKNRPQGGMMAPEDLVPPYVFMSSAGADHMTGQVLAVDDGRSV